ncbi:SpoIIE family protein phosphatase [Actinoplanes friuliensis]|uniref:Phosphoserine phosphatase rsbP n=1 Tax=Actinoplanes friuliensis DSM 7358 TaxID=1246995 RepID=U5VRM0_9ACTN|nr:SpoIIE family protein phosphatase [Actinoplanes friuliensis]AGZ39509.1 Phosphoserine phosphatase rsbP [Actinoplanes friuliensis DSM 7358]
MAEDAEAVAGGKAGSLADPARLQSLQRVCVGAEPDAAFDRFASLVKRLLDVPVALVSLVDDERQFFPGQVGLAEPWSGKRETPLTHSFCQYVVVEGVPKVFPDARIYAQVRDNLAIPELGVVAYAGMPLTDADGRTLGSLCAIDTKPRAWTRAELETLNDLAEACSSELRLRIERELAEEARRHAENAHDQLAMLAELTETLATTIDIDEALSSLGSAVTPRLADWCLISLVDPDGSVRQVSAAHHDPARAEDVTRFAELMTTGLGAKSIVLAVQRTGMAIRRDGETPANILDRTSNPEMADLAARLGYASFVVAPITAPVNHRVLGSITLVNGPSRPPFGDADERTGTDIGRRAGLALDNSRLYRQQRHVAEVLQQSMLTELPTIPGVELHARYLPAQDGAAVGGDWYDAFAQPDGSVMLAVGDVSGHDIEAAATMGQLRNLVRGDAYGREDEPGPLLTQLDRAVRGLRVPASATAILARMSRDGDDYTVAFSNAGHPPPLLLLPDGTVEIWWVRPEPLLGLALRNERSTHHRRVPAGSTLVLYTDGLVETPGRMLDDGIATIEAALHGNAALPGEELCARLLDAAARRADDIALLLIRVG